MQKIRYLTTQLIPRYIPLIGEQIRYSWVKYFAVVIPLAIIMFEFQKVICRGKIFVYEKKTNLDLGLMEGNKGYCHNEMKTKKLY